MKCYVIGILRFGGCALGVERVSRITLCEFDGSTGGMVR